MGGVLALVVSVTVSLLIFNSSLGGDGWGASFWLMLSFGLTAAVEFWVVALLALFLVRLVL